MEKRPITVLEETKASARTLSGEVNGRIWGARAADYLTTLSPHPAMEEGVALARPAYAAMFSEVLGVE